MPPKAAPRSKQRQKSATGGPAAAGRPAGFYEAALSEAERLLLEQARDQRGLEEEMALLRLKLQTLAIDQPDDLNRFLRLLELLTRMVATQYRVSKQAESDLTESLVSVAKRLGSVLGLGEEGGADAPR